MRTRLPLAGLPGTPAFTRAYIEDFAGVQAWFHYDPHSPDCFAERLAELDPAQPILCICHHGMRSAQVVAFLERAGFDSVYNLAGGIDAWSARVDPAVPRY